MVSKERLLNQQRVRETREQRRKGLLPSFALPSKSALSRTSFSVPQRIIRDYVKLVPLEERQSTSVGYIQSLYCVCPDLIRDALKVKPELKTLVAAYHKNREGVNIKRWHGYLAYILVDALDLFLPEEKNPDGSVPRIVPPCVRRRLYINKLIANSASYKERERDPKKAKEIPLQMTYHQNTLYACWTALTVSTERHIGGAWGVDKSEVDEVYCPFKGYVPIGISAPHLHQIKSNDTALQKNLLCQHFYYNYPHWEFEKAYVKEAWYLMYFEGYTYAQLSAHFGYSARSTMCMKFSKLHKVLQEWLKSSVEGKEVYEVEEIHLTAADKLKELYSALFRRINWAKRANKTERQMYICFHFLGWSPTAIADEFLVDLSTVRRVLCDKWGEVTAKRYLKEGLLELPCKLVSIEQELTLNERFPLTPKMIKEQTLAKTKIHEIINRWYYNE